MIFKNRENQEKIEKSPKNHSKTAPKHNRLARLARSEAVPGRPECPVPLSSPRGGTAAAGFSVSGCPGAQQGRGATHQSGDAPGVGPLAATITPAAETDPPRVRHAAEVFSGNGERTLRGDGVPLRRHGPSASASDSRSLRGRTWWSLRCERGSGARRGPRARASRSRSLRARPQS